MWKMRRKRREERRVVVFIILGLVFVAMSFYGVSSLAVSILTGGQ